MLKLGMAAAEVAAVVRVAHELGVAVTARGAGTGLSGACIPTAGGIVVSFERMDALLEIDEDDHVAVVQPGLTLAALDENGLVGARNRRQAPLGACKELRRHAFGDEAVGMMALHKLAVARFDFIIRR